MALEAFSLEGKGAVVTGAAQGIGRTIAIEFARASRADPGIDVQCLLAVGLGALVTRAARLCHDAVKPRIVGCSATRHGGALARRSGRRQRVPRLG